MNALTSYLRRTIFSPKLTLSETVVAPFIQSQQVRGKWVDCRMKKDARKRKTLEKYGPEKQRLNALNRAKHILPIEIMEIVRDELTNKIPRDAHKSRIVHRCQLTSKPRNVLVRWRLGRMMFRHLADGNRLSGVQRALW